MNPRKLLEKAKELKESGAVEQAEAIYREITEIDAGCEEAFFHLGNIFHLQGQIGKAIKAFSKVLEINPENTDASISLSVIYNDIGQYEKAKQIFETADHRVRGKKASGVPDDPHINRKFSEKHFELGELYFTYARYDEAIFEYNKAISLCPEDLTVRIKIAKTYAKKGFVEKAIEECRKLKLEYPEFLDARVALGVLYFGQGKVIEAQREWELVKSKDPYHEEAGIYLNLSKTANETTI